MLLQEFFTSNLENTFGLYNYSKNKITVNGEYYIATAMTKLLNDKKNNELQGRSTYILEFTRTFKRLFVLGKKI